MEIPETLAHTIFNGTCLMIQTFIRWFIFIVAILLATITVMLTPVGLKIGFFIARHWVPGELHYQQISGILIGPINIKNLHYHDHNVDITIKRLQLRWQLGSLFKKKIYIDQLIAKNISIIQTKGDATTNISWQTLITYLKKLEINTVRPTHWQQKAEKFKLPFSWVINNTHLMNINYGFKKNDYPVQIKSIRLQTKITQQHLNVYLESEMLRPYPNRTTLSLQGTFAHYQLTVISHNTYFNWNLQGDGNWQHINFIIPKSQTLNGRISGTINLRWSPQLRWKINLTAEKLNFKRLNTQWPKGLNLIVNSQGQIKNGQPRFSFDGTFTMPNTHLHISTQYQREWLIHWETSIKQLSALNDNLSGTMNSSGKLSGSLQKPLTQGTLLIKHASFWGLQIGQLHSQWHLDFTNKKISQLKLRAEKFVIKHFLLNQLQLNANGKFNSHHIIGAINLGENNYAFTLQGRLHNTNWRGKLEQFSYTHPHISTWRLQSSGTLQLSPTSIMITTTCFHSSIGGQMCLHGNWNISQPWQIHITGKNVNLQNIVNVFNPDLKVHGKGELFANAIGEDTALKNAQIHMKLTPGRLNYIAGKHKLSSSYRSGAFTGTFNQNGLKASLQFNLPKQDNLFITITLPTYRGHGLPQINMPIQGQIKASLSSLNFISVFIPYTATPKGKLIANLNLSGTLSKPILQGEANLQKGSLFIPELELLLTDITISMNAQENIVHYQAKATSQGQLITITGQTNVTKTPFSTEIHVQGKNVLIMNTKEYVIHASPDITIHTEGNLVNLSGQIEIPKAEIKPYDFRNVVVLPEHDVIFIGKRPTETRKRWLLKTHVELILGNEVNIDTLGVVGLLRGKLIFDGTPTQTMLATGRISLIHGTYGTYGHIFKINPKSYIQYTRTPINNPNLNIKATKTINVFITSVQQLAQQQYVVGVTVLGDFKHPKIRLFSIPPNLSQTDILSYLLFGSSSHASTASDISLLTQAIESTKFGSEGIGGTQNFINDIQQGLGLSEMGIETETTVDAAGNPISQQSAFVIGKYLTKNLYLRYTSGISGPGLVNVNEFTLRYLISKHWVIQTNTNTLGTGGDILYTVEKK